MSDEAAAHLMFPTLVMTSKIVALTSEQMAQIEKLSGHEVRDKTMKVFSAKSGAVVIIDRV